MLDCLIDTFAPVNCGNRKSDGWLLQRVFFGVKQMDAQGVGIIPGSVRENDNRPARFQININKTVVAERIAAVSNFVVD